MFLQKFRQAHYRTCISLISPVNILLDGRHKKLINVNGYPFLPLPFIIHFIINHCFDSFTRFYLLYSCVSFIDLLTYRHRMLGSTRVFCLTLDSSKSRNVFLTISRALFYRMLIFYPKMTICYTDVRKTQPISLRTSIGTIIRKCITDCYVGVT